MVGLVFKALGIILVLWIAGAGMPAIPSLLIGALAGVLNAILKIYFFAMIILIILSWVAPQANHPGALLVFQITEPVMAPLRRVIPPLGPLDLSPIVLFLIINLLDSLVVNALARAAGYPVGALIGF